jgi:hypothetical protein
MVKNNMNSNLINERTYKFIQELSIEYKVSGHWEYRKSYPSHHLLLIQRVPFYNGFADGNPFGETKIGFTFVTGENLYKFDYNCGKEYFDNDTLENRIYFIRQYFQDFINLKKRLNDEMKEHYIEYYDDVGYPY